MEQTIIVVPAGGSYTLSEVVCKDGTREIIFTVLDADEVQQSIPKWMFLRIASAGFSARAEGAFDALSIEYLGELAQMLPKDLLLIHNFGRKSLKEVQAFFSQQGWELGTLVSEDVLRITLAARGLGLCNGPISKDRYSGKRRVRNAWDRVQKWYRLEG